MARHHLTHAEEVRGGEHSHSHHHKMAKHHHAEMKKHIDHLHKMAAHAHKGRHVHHHVTAHDRAVDRENLAKARAARSHHGHHSHHTHHGHMAKRNVMASR
jgi:hypothetical protein